MYCTNLRRTEPQGGRGGGGKGRRRERREDGRDGLEFIFVFVGFWWRHDSNDGTLNLVRGHDFQEARMIRREGRRESRIQR